jgi:hypothetical protein
MSALRASIAALGELAQMLPRSLSLPPQAHRPTYQAMLKLTNGGHVAPALPMKARLEQVWQAIEKIRAAGGDYAELDRRDLRDAPWLLWDRSARAAEIKPLFQLLLERAETQSNVLRRLIDAWLIGFDRNDPTIAEAGAAIARSLTLHSQSHITRWGQLHEALRIFHPTEGPERFAMALLARDTRQVLRMGGFDQPQRAVSAYMRGVTQAYGRRLPDTLSGPDAKARLEAAQSFFTLNNKLRFDEPQMRGLVADALVGPFHAGAGPDHLRPDILAFLRQHLGDLRMNPVGWDGSSQQTRDIVRGWLAALTLNAFFDVIGQFAARSGNDSTWQARKLFWTACLQKGWIADSWLALGERVAAHIAPNRELRGSYARLEQVKGPNQSALLMRIGSLVFVEWSHNGKLYAWKSDSKAAPKLAPKMRYTAGDLEGLCLSFPAPSGRFDLAPTGIDGLVHSPGVWQGRVAELLRTHEGLHLSPHEWSGP